jgi:hypothetical protein
MSKTSKGNSGYRVYNGISFKPRRKTSAVSVHYNLVQ